MLLASKTADHVIVVNDGSTDSTAEVLSIPPVNVTILTHPQNRGYGGALKTLFEYFMANIISSDDILVTLDGDGQHDPREATRIVAPILGGEADIVIGSRFLSSEGYIPGARKFAIEWLNDILKKKVGLTVSDSQSGYRAYSVRAAETILTKMKMTNMGASLEILEIAREYGFTIEEVPILCTYEDVDGSGQNMITHGADLLGGLIQGLVEKNAKWILLLSLLIGFMGVVFGIRCVQLYNKLGILIPNYAIISLSLVILATTTAQMAITLYSLARLKENL